MDGNVSVYAPTSIPISTSSAWGAAGNSYDLDESNSTSSIKRYFLSYNGVLQGANLGISFTISGTTITLDVNDSIGGTERPSYYKNGGTTVSSGTGTVSVNDVIELWGLGGSPQVDMLLAEITVPSGLAKQSGGGVEPSVIMTSASQDGYTVTSSSTHSGSANYKAFNKSYAPATDDYWMAEPYTHGKYDGGGGNYNGINSLGGVSGEWIALQIPTPKIMGSVHITARDLLIDSNGSWDERNKAPKDFKVFGSNDGTNWTEVLSVTGANIQDITNGGGGKFNMHTTSVAYNRFALVVQAVNLVNGVQGVHLAVSEIEYTVLSDDASNAVLYYDATGTTFYGIESWNSSSQSNAFKVPFSSIEVPSSLIDFSVFTWGTSIEFAQEYLRANFGDLNPRFILNGVQATSSNSDFASTTQYLPNGHGVNFWGSSENLAEFKFTSNIHGKCKIIYGCTWNQNAVRIALNGTEIYNTTSIETTVEFDVSVGDEINIYENPMSVIALYSITLNQLLGSSDRTIITTIKPTDDDANKKFQICGYGGFSTVSASFGIRISNHAVNGGGGTSNSSEYAVGIMGNSNDIYFPNLKIYRNVETTIAVSYKSSNNTGYLFVKNPSSGIWEMDSQVFPNGNLNTRFTGSGTHGTDGFMIGGYPVDNNGNNIYDAFVGTIGELFVYDYYIDNVDDIKAKNYNNIPAYSYHASAYNFTGSSGIDLSSDYDLVAAGLMGNASRMAIATVKIPFVSTSDPNYKAFQYVFTYGGWGPRGHDFGIRIDTAVESPYGRIGLALWGDEPWSDILRLESNVETTIGASYDGTTGRVYFFLKNPTTGSWAMEEANYPADWVFTGAGATVNTHVGDVIKGILLGAGAVDDGTHSSPLISGSTISDFAIYDYAITKLDEIPDISRKEPVSITQTTVFNYTGRDIENELNAIVEEKPAWLLPEEEHRFILDGRMIGTEDDFPADFGTLTKHNGTQALITNWTMDTDNNLVLSSYDNIAEADGYWTRYIKVTQNGSYIPGSGKYKAGNNAYYSPSLLLSDYNTGTSYEYGFVKGADFDNIFKNLSLIHISEPTRPL